MITQFDRSLDFRTAQFSALEYVLLGRQLSAEIRPSGKPVMSGYISSYFGERMDPFNGEEAFHKGLDFASEAGTDVLAVAQGVVTWAGPREGYGVLVEVNHGNGYVTRYAHNSRVLVAAGDTVERGQTIAVVGSTGRSTGPHVHFEVLKDGRQIDPMAFIGHYAAASRRPLTPSFGPAVVPWKCIGRAMAPFRTAPGSPRFQLMWRVPAALKAWSRIAALAAQASAAHRGLKSRGTEARSRELPNNT